MFDAKKSQRVEKRINHLGAMYDVTYCLSLRKNDHLTPISTVSIIFGTFEKKNKQN